MKEEFVTIECSKLLKEKGYDGKTSGRYVEKIPGSEREEWDVADMMYHTVTDVVTFPRVHLYDAQKWLREKHGLHIDVRVTIEGMYFWEICDLNKQVRMCSPGESPEYEYVLQSAINKALTLIKEEEKK